MKLSKESYLKLIELDIKALEEEMDDCLERGHIISVLKESVNFYYPVQDEPETYIKFHPDDEEFNVGEFIEPKGTKDGFVTMEKSSMAEVKDKIWMVWNTTADERGCMLAKEIKIKI